MTTYVMGCLAAPPLASNKHMCRLLACRAVFTAYAYRREKRAVFGVNDGMRTGSATADGKLSKGPMQVPDSLRMTFPEPGSIVCACMCVCAFGEIQRTRHMQSQLSMGSSRFGSGT